MHFDLNYIVLDKALGQNQSQGGIQFIDPAKNPAAREFSDLFTTNPRQCDELEKLDEVEFLKCLTEHGLAYATILYASQTGNMDKEGHISQMCEILAAGAENVEILNKDVHLLPKMLANCLSRIQIKLFTSNMWPTRTR